MRSEGAPITSVRTPFARDDLRPVMSRKLTFHETTGQTPRQFFLFRPSTERKGAPIVVSVHGIARNAAAHAFRLMADAERYGLVVVAPLFSKEHYGQYQQLEDAKTGVRSDIALLEVLNRVGQLSSADATKTLLFGYSGGAQFAHRFAMAHPKRVCSAVLAAAGWYTFPDEGTRYPRGLDTRAAASSLRFDKSDFTQVRFHVVIGELDTERDNSLRKGKRLDRTQGRSRLERASNWVTAMSFLAFQEQGHAPPTLSVLPGAGHSFADCIEKADLTKHVFALFEADAALPEIEFMEGERHV